MYNNYYLTENGIISTEKFSLWQDTWKKLAICTVFTDKGYIEIDSIENVACSCFVNVYTQCGHNIIVPDFYKFRIFYNTDYPFIDAKYLQEGDPIELIFGGNTSHKASYITIMNSSIIIDSKFIKNLAYNYCVGQKDDLDFLLTKDLVQFLGFLPYEILFDFFNYLFELGNNSFKITDGLDAEFFMVLLASLGYRVYLDKDVIYLIDNICNSGTNTVFDRVVKVKQIQKDEYIHIIKLKEQVKWLAINGFTISQDPPRIPKRKRNRTSTAF